MELRSYGRDLIYGSVPAVTWNIKLFKVILADNSLFLIISIIARANRAAEIETIA